MAAKQQKQPFVDQKTTDLACTYAALILHDDGLEISATQMNKLFKHLNLRVEPFWPKVYEKALKGKNIGDLLLGGGSSDAPAVAAGGKQAPAKEANKPAAKVQEIVAEVVEDMDMGGLFD